MNLCAENNAIKKLINEFEAKYGYIITVSQEELGEYVLITARKNISAIEIETITAGFKPIEDQYMPDDEKYKANYILRMINKSLIDIEKIISQEDLK